MEREEFSFGPNGERLSPTGRSSNSPIPIGEKLPERRFQPTSHDQLRVALREYRGIMGQPTEVPDLRVDGLMARILLRSPWSATVTIFLSEDVPVLSKVRDEVELNLSGRDPQVTLDDKLLMATYQIEDGSEATRKRAVDFGRTLALILNGVHDVRVGSLDQDSHQGAK